MAKNARVVIAAALLALLAILLVLSDYPLVGAGVFVVGMLGLAVIRERDPELGGGDAQAKLERAMDRGNGPSEATPTPTPTPAAPTSPSDGLPTWRPTSRPPTSPEAGLGGGPTSFSPESTFGSGPTAFSPSTAPRMPTRPTEPPVALPSSASARDTRIDTDRGPVAERYDEQNPLADLDRLDEIDPVAEVERLERLGPSSPAAASNFSFSAAPPLINESAVHTADDVMAASQATELEHVGVSEDSELARLLAKVQQRLAAYE